MSNWNRKMRSLLNKNWLLKTKIIKVRIKDKKMNKTFKKMTINSIADGSKPNLEPHNFRMSSLHKIVTNNCNNKKMMWAIRVIHKTKPHNKWWSNGHKKNGTLKTKCRSSNKITTTKTTTIESLTIYIDR